MAYGPHVSASLGIRSSSELGWLNTHMQNIINLAEQQGKEAAVTNAYRDYVGELSDKDVL